MAELLLNLGRSCFMEITSDTNHDLTGSYREWQEPVFFARGGKPPWQPHASFPCT